MKQNLVAHCLSVKSFKVTALLPPLGSDRCCYVSDHGFTAIKLFFYFTLTILETEHPLVTVVFTDSS